ncbi:MAG: antA/AntB antirepressor family protein [Negativicutes bacterium]
MNELIKIDTDGKITARNLYEFLQLAPSQFSRWAKTNIEDNPFYSEGTDWWGFDIVSNGNGTRDYRLTIDFAKHLCMLSRSERGKQARNYFIEIESRYQKQIAPTDPLDLIILQATMMKELRQKQEAQARVQIEQGHQLKQLAAKQITSPTEYFTIAGFASLRGIRVDINRAALLGRKAVFLSKEYKYDVGKTHDPRFGQVNTYHSDILAQVFASR